MGNLGNLGLTGEETLPSFDPVPAGWHRGIITGEIIKDTKKGDGAYLELTVELMDAPVTGRKLWVRLTVANPNQKAVEIGKAQMSALAKACGIDPAKLQDSSQFLNCVADYFVTHREYNGEKREEVKKFRAPANGTGGAQAHPDTAQSYADNAPSWRR